MAFRNCFAEVGILMGAGVGVRVRGRMGAGNRLLRLRGAMKGARIQGRGLLTESYSVGSAEPPLLPHTIPEHFHRIVEQHGSNLALVSHAQNAKLTYRELDERSNVLAHGLRALGVGKGDRVAVSLGNGWEFGALTYAIWKLGAVLVPLNPAFNTKQVESALNHLGTSHLVIGRETHLPFKNPRDNTPLLEDLIGDLAQANWRSETVPSLRNVVLVHSAEGDGSAGFASTTPFRDLIQGYESQREKEVIPNEKLHRDDVINIQFTSGTTSSPKAACLTHHSILNNGHSIGSRMGLTPSDIVCCPPPLFHCFGSILGYMATATHGSTILFPSPAFHPAATLQSIQSHGATALYGVTTMFLAELELLASGAIPQTGFSTLRTGIAAGSSVPKSLMQKLHHELNLTGLTICYGMTETSPVSCMTTPTDPMDKRLDSVGRVLPHVSAKIVSPSHPHEILPLGHQGELLVSGYLVMKGYYADEERTREVLVRDADGRVWMRTGDEARMDAQGYVEVTGRIKDLIIRGGENIHPVEIENAILGVEGVADVSVVGVADRSGGGGVKTYQGEDSTACVRRHLSGHLVPRYVFWTEGYPKTASGKIQKFKLRERAEWIVGGGGE
ncbi:hypothetical protein EYC80_008892 [Monilinia laxa]|uniref:AMP-dependent synthetase/ligase domain-containing protein n=2 Tax=Monilinia laxa TaxID=61186 RepID=A0A5N6K1U6_MONLA|nr:hypothetical protein EYC80_008892 [Monilinia laxa]